MLECLVLLIHIGVLGNVLCPLDVDNGFQLLVIVDSQVCLQGGQLSRQSFNEIEQFFLNLGNGHAACAIVKPLLKLLYWAINQL